MLGDQCEMPPQVGRTSGWLWEPEKPYPINHGVEVDWDVFQMLSGRDPYAKDHSLEVDWEVFKMLGEHSEKSQVGKVQGWLWEPEKPYAINHGLEVDWDAFRTLGEE